MKTKWTYLLLMLLVSTSLLAQVPGAEEGYKEDENSQEIDPKDRMWSWQLIDDFTFVDSVQIDTMTTGVHQYDPIFKESFSNVFLGNKGSAYTSNLLSHKTDFNEFIFLNSLQLHFMQPEDLKYFNTKTPYTNLTYYYGGPGRRSEENFRGSFTQNINKKLNYGVMYNLVSSIGLYEAQKVDNRNFNFKMSYQSDKYSIHGAVLYNSANHLENGGIDGNNHDFIWNPDDYDYGQAENIPVKYMTATNNVENFQFFTHQSLGIGKIKFKNNTLEPPVDSLVQNEDEYLEEVELPVSTVFHTLHVSSYKRSYNIENLNSYYDTDDILPLYDNVYVDSLRTADSTRYSSIKNTIQIRFNEEANSLLKFGLRAYISNEVKNYTYHTKHDSLKVDSEDEEYELHYRSKDTTLVTTYIGGQIFKNLGENFWWNAGARLCVQGYKAGDIDLEGNINSLYPVFKDTAGVYARGLFQLRTAEFLQENYYSNHFKWDRNFRQEKNVNFEFGLNIPTRNLRLSWESKLMTDHIYWDEYAMPQQTEQLINAFQITLLKDFTLGAFHSDNKLAYQYSNNQDLYPVPDFAGFSSNYFNFYLAKKVLQVQVGVDVRYHTSFYAQAYMPATGQFYLQKEQRIGNYPFMDAFMNLQLKRARIFVKFDHFNQSFMDRNYFLTLGYPYAPIRFKWGVSWNFYD
ncbi:hypothetical protein E9993_15205 [Labilibacter sediminis]|nr:hypothetical protein E9993_15205 [Labilibacter sediminis]